MLNNHCRASADQSLIFFFLIFLCSDPENWYEVLSYIGLEVYQSSSLNKIVLEQANTSFIFFSNIFFSTNEEIQTSCIACNI